MLCKNITVPISPRKNKKIDYSKALSGKGVIDIITNQNVPEIEWYYTSYLFDPHLRYQGDEIACVAAETEELAEEALKLIDVEYELLPFVIDAAEAMKQDAPKFYEKSNIVRGKPVVYGGVTLNRVFRKLIL